MKKIIFGIFAHPDDEAFGPAGTLLQEAKSGTELHLVTLTAGDAGANPDSVPDLAKTRLNEWHAAGALLGAKSMHFLGYKDGHLSNDVLLEVAKRLVDLITDTLKNAPEDIEVECMSFDFSGLSGHIDHIVATRAACWAFYTLKQRDARFRRIRLYCLSAETYPTHNIDWLYMEPGRTAEEVDETIDASALRTDIIDVMRAHHTQRADCERYLKAQGDHLGVNHFVVKN